MRNLVRSALILTTLLTFPTLPTAAQETSPNPEPEASPASAAMIEVLPYETLAALANKSSVEEFTAGLVSSFRSVVNGDGVLSAQVIADRASVQAANARANKIEEILRADLDGDGAVTRTELAKSWASRRHAGSAEDQAIAAQRQSAELERAMAPDVNADDVITFDEMRQAAAKSAERQRDRRGDIAVALLALDGDGDAAVTLREVRVAAQRIFAHFDADGDGEISDAEQSVAAAAAQQANLRRRLREPVAGCNLPPPPDNLRFVLLSTARGLEIPTTTLAGQDGVTWSGSVEIESGSDKLWVLAAADEPMVWRLSGAVDRIEKFVVITNGDEDHLAAAGVTGLARDRVVFVDSSYCRIRDFLQRQKAHADDHLMAEVFGRVPDDTILAPAFLRVSLPSGSVFDRKAATTPDADNLPLDVWQQSQGFGKTPVAEIDVASVWTKGKVEAYQVLPADAGIVQLIRAGSIVPRPRQSFLRADGKPLQMQTVYRGNLFEIVKPLPRFPGGLPSSNPVTFVLAKGIPMPAGSIFPSCVLDGTTGLPLVASPICPAR